MTYAKKIVINCHYCYLSMLSPNQDHWDCFQMGVRGCVKTIQGSKIYVFVFFSVNYGRKTMKREKCFAAITFYIRQR